MANKLRDTIIPAILGAQPRVVEGPRGPQGFDGIRGEIGPRGQSIHSGFGLPEPDLGIDGDLYLDVETGDVWKRD